MSASKRISEAFRYAPEIPFDDDSKIVLMSDCHRGDGSWTDSFASNRNLFLAALNEYNEDKFTYIELGDGDELWESVDFAAIGYSYRDIFSLMSRMYSDGRLYLLYGNHDMDKRDLSFVKLNYESLAFPDVVIYEGVILRHKNGNRLYLLHGHQADYFNDKLWRLSRFMVRRLWTPLETLGVNDPTSASQNSRKKSKVEQKLSRWAREQASILIAGHTHRPVLPKPGEGLYFNDGSCVHREYITALELQGGMVSLVKWSHKTKSDGIIYVGRDVLQGPEKLSDYYEY
ncbi:MAG: serine/threonine protein phosphatase [Clostridiales bacterium]|jgi:UDP-2,3-diacylglucosamine pyrophosphatase LpxH|nr:serine/threonine protein phosphatase [Clostridiales bacterium]